MARSPDIFQSLIDASVLGILSTDSRGYVRTFNPAAESIFGYSRDELVGKSASILIPELAHRAISGQVADDAVSEPSRFIGANHEVAGRRKDGAHFPLHLSVGTFHLDGEQMFMAILNPLSSDVASRRALQQSQLRFRQLVDNIDEVFILRTTAPYRYVYISPAVESVFGLTADEATSDPARFLSFTHPDDLDFVRATMERAAHSPNVEVEYRIIRADGEVRWVWTRYRPVEVQPGDPPMVAVVVTDITAQKLAQQAEASARAEAVHANAAKTEFLSRMSHELRTPMNAILGFAQLLGLDELSDDQHESVRQIMRGGRHLLDLINEVLDISRIDSGQMALSPEPVRVSDVMDEVMDLMAPLVEARNLTFHAPVDGECHHHVLADRQRLKQVLMNLVSNAIKYNRTGGEIRVRCHLRPGGEVSFSVIDTGIGMGPAELQRLFTPFDRLGREGSGEEGTGVGLALSQRLIHLMGGRIEVESSAGVGSTFTVVMPLSGSAEWPHAGENRSDAGSASSEEASHATTTPLAVLYVEDNLANVRLMERITALRPRVTLTHAMQGGLALELIASTRPDLILLDLHLPDMSGEEVLRRLRAENETRDIPTVVVSADASPGQIRRVIELGAAGYLTKPFKIEEMLAWFDEPHRMATNHVDHGE